MACCKAISVLFFYSLWARHENTLKLSLKIREIGLHENREQETTQSTNDTNIYKHCGKHFVYLCSVENCIRRICRLMLGSQVKCFGCMRNAHPQFIHNTCYFDQACGTRPLFFLLFFFTVYGPDSGSGRLHANCHNERESLICS